MFCRLDAMLCSCADECACTSELFCSVCEIGHFVALYASPFHVCGLSIACDDVRRSPSLPVPAWRRIVLCRSAAVVYSHVGEVVAC